LLRVRSNLPQNRHLGENYLREKSAPLGSKAARPAAKTKVFIMIWAYWVSGIITVLLMIYLVVAVLLAEKF
jgi:K+-transporting ATPase KdpF subunit